MKEALERMWPVLSGAELVNDLLRVPRAGALGVGRSLLTDDEQDAAAPARDPRRRATSPWTEADVALVDEADSLLGPVEAARPAPRRRRGSDEDARHASARHRRSRPATATPTRPTLANRYGDRRATNGADGASFEPRTFGHVLVDEAQDLTAMQWRMLARRCPSGSMTLVGDPGQASKPGAVASWDDVLAHLPQHTTRPASSRSRINYRTPAEVMDVAARLLAVAAPTVEPSRSVRSTGEHPRFVATSAATTSSTRPPSTTRAALEPHRHASR